MPTHLARLRAVHASAFLNPGGDARQAAPCCVPSPPGQGAALGPPRRSGKPWKWAASCGRTTKASRPNSSPVPGAAHAAVVRPTAPSPLNFDRGYRRPVTNRSVRLTGSIVQKDQALARWPAIVRTDHWCAWSEPAQVGILTSKRRRCLGIRLRFDDLAPLAWPNKARRIVISKT